MSTKIPMLLNTQESEILYRRPDLGEVDSIYKLFNHLLDSNFPMFPVESLMAYKKQLSKAKIEERLKSSLEFLLSAWYNNNPVGLALGSAPEGGVATIIWVIVEEKYQNQKIGKNLLLHACNFYRNLGCHKIKLTAPSEKAKNFYLQQGMLLEGFHPNHWWKMDFWSFAKLI